MSVKTTKYIGEAGQTIIRALRGETDKANVTVTLNGVVAAFTWAADNESIILGAPLVGGEAVEISINTMKPPSNSAPDFDSGWFAPKSWWEVKIPHNLGVIPAHTVLQIKDTLTNTVTVDGIVGYKLTSGHAISAMFDASNHYIQFGDTTSLRRYFSAFNSFGKPTGWLTETFPVEYRILAWR